MIPTSILFPGTAYVDQYTDADATGDIIVDQPATLKSVALDLAVAQLNPNTTYTVFFDPGGYLPGQPSTIGNCRNMGTFTTDEDGLGEWSYDSSLDATNPFVATSPSGTSYTIDVIVNLVVPNRSVLISAGNITFTIK